MAREVQVTFDGADPAALAEFWALALEEGKTVHTLEQLATELVAAGATRPQRIEGNGMDEGNIVMADPEGHEFCLD